VGIIETCVALTDHLVLVGTQNGTLYCFDKETDELVTIYNESGKDYKNNAITCIDVHPKRQEFVVLGF
jgi:outer membrane protein assembly factor BamB